jgi:hypothetical protein
MAAGRASGQASPDRTSKNSKEVARAGQGERAEEPASRRRLVHHEALHLARGRRSCRFTLASTDQNSRGGGSEAPPPRPVANAVPHALQQFIASFPPCKPSTAIPTQMPPQIRMIHAISDRGNREEWGVGVGDPVTAPAQMPTVTT